MARASGPREPAAQRAFRGVTGLLAVALAASLVATAFHDVSKAWDTWAYHLPFAARIWGIVGPDAYVFSAENAARYQGFPLVVEALQGLAWRVTDRPESANFAALFALFGFVAFLWRTFGLRPETALLALLGVPLVQIHATQCYVDLPANLGASALVLLAYRAWADEAARPRRRTLVIALVVAALTANSKFQLVPVVLAALVALVARARRDATLLVLLVVFAPLVLATPIKNALRYGNPAWPVELSILGRALPFADTRYASSPAWLEHAPAPVRFVCSVLEIGVRSWSVDQWTPPDDPGYRMGGFSGVYAVVALLAVVLAALRKRTRGAKVALVFVLVAGALTSVMPQSHELRYYLFFMVTLVSLALASWEPSHPVLASGVALVAFALVVVRTGGVYVWPSGDSFDALVASRVDLGVIETARRAPERDRVVCVAEEPWTFLYAARFHPGPRFTVLEAKSPEDCSALPPPLHPPR